MPGTFITLKGSRVKISGIILTFFALICLPGAARSQAAAQAGQQVQNDQPQLKKRPADASAESDPDLKKRIAENVIYILSPEERKVFSSRPSPGPPSLRPGGAGGADSAAADDSDAGRLLQQGDNEIVLGHGPAAAELFQKVLDKFPGQPRATYGLAIASALSGKADTAQDLFGKLANTPPTAKPGVDPLYVAWSHVYLGRICELEGDRNAAVREYRAATTLVDAPGAARDAGQFGLDHPVNLDEINAAGQPGAAPAASPEEDTAYAAVAAIPNTDRASADKKIQLGQDFLDKYPSSRYVESVYSQLLLLHYTRQEWNEFYATADKILAKDPDNVDTLTLVGWVIPHFYYNRSTPVAAGKLNQAETYEKHALELIPSIPKPDGYSDTQFAQARAEQLAQAHSGLGLVYFRGKDFGNAATELQLSIQGSAGVDPTDVYTLGVALHELGRELDASEAFAKCAQIPGDLQDRCKQAADALKNTR
jgi:tetratricopeptide (TPR) repeat protein